MIEIKGLRKSFGDQLIFDDLNIDIDRCGLYGIVGSSGSGKSTLLNMIFKNEPCDEGSIIVDGTMAMIYQNYELIDELNVLTNITLYRKNLKNLNKIIKDLGLKELLSHYPKELSGGQAQRVGIARALVFDPDIILCDEPCESLDIDNKIIVMDMLKKLSQDKIVIMVSHDQEMVEKYCDVIFTIKDNDIQQDVGLTDRQKFYPKNNQISAVDAKRIIRKTMQKKNIIFSVILAVLMLILGSLKILSQDHFVFNESQDVLNIDMIYLDVDESYILQDNALNLPLEPIISFKDLCFDDRSYNVNIIPYVENDKYAKPDEGMVLINDHLAKMLGFKEGDEVILTYEQIQGDMQEMTFMIKEIIVEDCTIPQVYYDHEPLFMAYDQIILNEEGLTFLDIFKSQATRYQAKVGYENIADTYSKYQDIAGINMYNLVYDERVDSFIKQKPLKLMADIAALCSYGILLLIIVVFNYRTNQKQLRYYGLLVNFGNDISKIKRMHVCYKVVSFVLIYLLIDGWLCLYRDAWLLLELIGILVVYIGTSNLQLNKLRQDNINLIMKTVN